MFAVFAGGDAVEAILEGRWTALVSLKQLLLLALPFATLILDGIVTPHFKAVLVYWKWRNPLPSHQAFSLHGKADKRVDMRALEQEHGRLPTDPVEQNLLWYKLSKATADEPSVDEAHYAWLLARDLTSLSFILLIISAGLTAAVRVGGWEWVVMFGTQVALYVAMRQVAANKGTRFVTTVLAEATVPR